MISQACRAFVVKLSWRSADAYGTRTEEEWHVSVPDVFCAIEAQTIAVTAACNASGLDAVARNHSKTRISVKTAPPSVVAYGADRRTS